MSRPLLSAKKYLRTYQFQVIKSSWWIYQNTLFSSSTNLSFLSRRSIIKRAFASSSADPQLHSTAISLISEGNATYNTWGKLLLPRYFWFAAIRRYFMGLSIILIRLIQASHIAILLRDLLKYESFINISMLALLVLLNIYFVF